MRRNKKELSILIFLIIVGLFVRLYKIDFGLPHSFHADEPEIGEFAIRYTFEIKDILKKDELYRLIPVSYVYGTLPSYFFAFTLMIYSKVSNILSITFDKTDLFIFMRQVNAILSMGIVYYGIKIYSLVFRSKSKSNIIILTILLISNWKLVAHAHYLNVDILLTLFNLASLYYFLSFIVFDKKRLLYISGILLGFAVGIKITALLVLPILLFWLYKQGKSLYKPTIYILSIFAGFIISNPFPFVFLQDFSLRILEMFTKENGLVFDSADFTYYKYILALNFILTPLAFLNSLYGIYISLKDKNRLSLLLIEVVGIYFIFFTLGSRRVDRWLLPILPIMLIYTAYGISRFRENYGNFKHIVNLLFTVGIYLYFLVILLMQLRQNTPKYNSYLWLRANLDESSNKLVVTKEGLDPLNKLKGVTVHNFNSYESDNGQYYFPDDPLGYDYVIVSSKPLDSYKNKYVRKKFEFYYQKWFEFENKLFNSGDFELIKVFSTVKPNLLELDDVLIFKSKNFNQDNL